jgi:hypothetical protein
MNPHRHNSSSSQGYIHQRDRTPRDFRSSGRAPRTHGTERYPHITPADVKRWNKHHAIESTVLYMTNIFKRVYTLQVDKNPPAL